MLSIATILVYLPSLFFDITRLDDFLFISRATRYKGLEAILLGPFKQGVFGQWDNYYRPLFIESNILNNLLFGKSVMAYHAVNILMHVVVVRLFYGLLKQLQVREYACLYLATIFAIHPILCQAVSWIPGRNDLLLAMFFIPFLRHTIYYANTYKSKHMAYMFLFLLLSLLTKELAVVFPAVALVVLTFIVPIKFQWRHWVMPSVLILVDIMLWYFLRSHAHLRGYHQSIWIYLNDFIHRIPILIQYLGKIFFPIALSVFPTQRDTTYVLGVLAMLLIATGMRRAAWPSIRFMLGCMVIFGVLLLPLLIIPRFISNHVFEHRVYLPIMFILLLPAQVPWGKWGISKALLRKVALIYIVALLGLNLRHQFNFRSPQAFWEQAVATTPHLGHSKAMLSFQIKDSIRALQLLQEAYKLDTNERYIHMNLARVYYQLHQYNLAEQHILIEDTLSKDLRCRYFKSRIWLQKGDTAAAIAQMKAYIFETSTKSMHTKDSLLQPQNWSSNASAALIISTIKE